MRHVTSLAGDVSLGKSRPKALQLVMAVS